MRLSNCLTCKKRCFTTRGLCRYHYHILRAMVLRGDTTWDRLITEGRVLPVAKSPLPAQRLPRVTYYPGSVQS